MRCGTERSCSVSTLRYANLPEPWNTQVSLASVVKDGTLSALFLGYRGLFGVAILGPWQQSVEQSFVAPLWTLSIEFYGSMIVLCRAGARGGRVRCADLCSRLGSANPNEINRLVFDRTAEVRIAIDLSKMAILLIKPGARGRAPVNKTLLLA